MSNNTPITSLPGYPYFYAIPIDNFIRDGPVRKPKRLSSKSRLQERHSLPPAYTPAPTWSPYILEGLAELDGLNEIPRQIYPDHQRPYEQKQEQIKRPQTTPPETAQTQAQGKRSRFPSLKTKYSWTAYRPQVSSPLSSTSSVDSFQNLCTIDEKKLEVSNGRVSQRDEVPEMAESEGDGMGDEERIQLVLIESIFLMLHNLQPTYLTRPESIVSQVLPRPSRKYRLSRQPSVRGIPMFAT